METPENNAVYPFSKLENDDGNCCYSDEYGAGISKPFVGGTSHLVGLRAWKQGYPYQGTSEPDFLDDGYSSSDEHSASMQSNLQPQVNFKTVLSGIFAILTGRNKGPICPEVQWDSSSKLSFLETGKNGDFFLNSSVYMPSAPPLLQPSGPYYSAYKEVLEAESPEWLPDSFTSSCMQCTLPFSPITRGRHHCRFCGAIFCKDCTKGRCLLPVKFRERDPQRVCDACYDRLDPIQGVLVKSNSNSAQVAKHDVVDWTCMRGWLNLPMGLSMEHEIYKSSNTLRSYSQAARLKPEMSIPSSVLKGAKGLAVLTVCKAGVLVTYKLGTGLVVSRRPDGSWSAPSAILSVGLGWGAQVGGELTDFVIVLHDYKSVKTFCSRMHFSLGAGLSAAAGPVGRVLEADIRAGDKGSGICYTYSCSKGAFVGVSLEGNFVLTRMDTNLRFYGDPYLTTRDILLGSLERPKAAEPLYSALADLYSELQC